MQVPGGQGAQPQRRLSPLLHSQSTCRHERCGHCPQRSECPLHASRRLSHSHSQSLMPALGRCGGSLRRARRAPRRVPGRVVHPLRQVRLGRAAPAARLVGLLRELAHAALLHGLPRQRALDAGLAVPRVLRHSCTGNTERSRLLCVTQHRRKQGHKVSPPTAMRAKELPNSFFNSLQVNNHIYHCRQK